MGFMEEMERNQKSYTENGAVGYETTGRKLVDLNFKIPSFRDGIDGVLFDEALAQDERLTLKWLLYLRDIRQGVGERKSFRDFVVYLADNYEETASNFITVCPLEEFGRWDDYIDIYYRTKSETIKNVIAKKISHQFNMDIENFHNNKSISLLAKWLPSINASSIKTKRKAKEMIRVLGVEKEKHYRKILSALRKYIDVVEKKMSENQWDSINYEGVPSKANLTYGKAFLEHDKERREKYIESLKSGDTKINANALFLHDIVHKYKQSDEYDETLEQMWKAQEKTDGFENTIVVRDGSGSMWSIIGNSNISALTVADAITLYCAENNTGEFKNKFITFSSKAKIVNISAYKSLMKKLDRLSKEDDYSNTNIENVFNLILDTAVKNNISKEDMPKTVLIISDMELDNATYDWDRHGSSVDRALFDTIADSYADKGYALPKLVFWNVNSRTNTIPLTQNENGVILLSGFSKNLMNMVMSSELDPYKALVKELEKPRYGIIDCIYE